MIYLTGDTHGGYDAGTRFSGADFPEGEGLTKDDFVIILGDFGYIFYPCENAKEELRLRGLERKPWTTLFLDGNHENFPRLNAFPVEDWNGGKVHRIRDTVLHLMRGQVYHLEGMTFFTMGGALSIDKKFRTENLSWWKEEIPSKEEMMEAVKNLALHKNKVNYVLTHTCPSSIVPHVVHGVVKDKTAEFLEVVFQHTAFKKWYFGHFHTDCRVDERFCCLFHEVIPLNGEDERILPSNS